MADLTIPVNGEYFYQMKSGEKVEEYRLRTPYWGKRLEGRTYDNVIITLGYPKKDSNERRIVVPWRGFETRKITHKHFGPDPVEVYAIRIELQKD